METKMAYKIINNLIQNGSKTNEEILNISRIYYLDGRISENEYEEIINKIGK